MDLCAFTHEQPRTRRCTIHPCALTTTLTKNNKSRQFRTHLDQSRNCLYPFVCGCAQQGNGSWQLLVVAGLGDSGERRVVGQVGGCHRQGPWVAKQQRSSTCCGPRPKRSCSTLCQWCCKAFDAKALGRDLRVHRGGTWANFSEDCSKSLHIVSNLQSKGSPFAALDFIGAQCSICRTVTSVIVATSLKTCWRGWRLHLEGASRERLHRADA